MKSMPLVALGLCALLPIACAKSKFAGQNESSEAFSVKVVDGADADADANANAQKGPEAARSEGSDDAVDHEAKDDQAACAATAGISANRVHVSGSEKDMTLTSDQAFALKVSGSTNTVTLKLSGQAPGTKLPALCLFVSGNQNHVILDIGMTVTQIFIKARGNQALIEGNVSKEGVIENIIIDAKGHEPRIDLKGDGQFPAL